MSNNYTVLHLHTDYSNPFTTIDSVTKYTDYVDKAKQLNMKAIAFTEHGGCLDWYRKKIYTEQQGLKYIHGVEAYLTESLSPPKRDNYHVILLAKNYDGVKEINRLMSYEVANNREDKHFYYNPRITFEELGNTSDDIIITTACLASPLNNAPLDFKNKYLQFLIKNKHRVYLEIQHHLVDDQIKYNAYLYNLHKEHNIPLVAATDTHSLNQRHFEARDVLQKAKNIHFENEDNWDLVFRSYDELCNFYEKQNSIPQYAWKEAIENTNKIARLIEEFEVDTSPKYPKLYDNSEEIFKQKINKAYANKNKNKPYSKQKSKERIYEEFEVYKKTGTIDYMLLQDYIRTYERKNGIHAGPGRGSINGSYIAYLLDITEMDSIKFDLNFFRFMNPDRASLADVDTDYADPERGIVKEFLLTNKNFNSSEIVTFNTIQTKGSIREVCRALNYSSSEANMIAKNIDNDRNYLEDKYPEVFEYLDILEGVIVSVGNHPAGVIITEHNIHEMLGTFSTTGTEHPVCVFDKYIVEDLGYVKIDVLGLDNIWLINKTCKMADINIITPDNIDLNDEKVWESIREDTTGIFQWEGSSAEQFYKKMFAPETIKIAKQYNPDFEYIKWMSFGNGLIRPACASFREDVANGIPKDHGFEPLNKFLSHTLGYVAMQEDIMNFLSKFCGYSMAEADNIRRLIAKKYDKVLLEQATVEIQQRFIDNVNKEYDLDRESAKEIIKPFVQVIIDASDYAFSWNHSDAYSCIGYMAGWLRYYYPYEFLTTALNIFDGKSSKTSRLIRYADKIGVSIQPAKFGVSKTGYRFDKEQQIIVKGLESIKGIGSSVGEELYGISKKVDKNTSFFTILELIQNETKVNSAQIETLIKLDFFRDYGKSKKLMRMFNVYNEFATAKQYNKSKIDNKLVEKIVTKYSRETPKQYQIENNLAIMNDLSDLMANQDYNPFEKARHQLEYLGYIKDSFPQIPNSYYIVADIIKKYKNPIVILLRISDNTEVTMKIKSYVYKNTPIEKMDIIKIHKTEESPRWRQIDGKWCQPDSEDTETILHEYYVRRIE